MKPLTKTLIIVGISAFAIIVGIILVIVINRVLKKANEVKRRELREKQRIINNSALQQDLYDDQMKMRNVHQQQQSSTYSINGSENIDTTTRSDNRTKKTDEVASSYKGTSTNRSLPIHTKKQQQHSKQFDEPVEWDTPPVSYRRKDRNVHTSTISTEKSGSNNSNNQFNDTRKIATSLLDKKISNISTEESSRKDQHKTGLMGNDEHLKKKNDNNNKRSSKIVHRNHRVPSGKDRNYLSTTDSDLDILVEKLGLKDKLTKEQWGNIRKQKPRDLTSIIRLVKTELYSPITATSIRMTETTISKDANIEHVIDKSLPDQSFIKDNNSSSTSKQPEENEIHQHQIVPSSDRADDIIASINDKHSTESNQQYGKDHKTDDNEPDKDSSKVEEATTVVTDKEEDEEAENSVNSQDEEEEDDMDPHAYMPLIPSLPEDFKGNAIYPTGRYHNPNVHNVVSTAQPPPFQPFVMITDRSNAWVQEQRVLTIRNYIDTTLNDIDQHGSNIAESDYTPRDHTEEDDSQTSDESDSPRIVQLDTNDESMDSNHTHNENETKNEDEESQNSDSEVVDGLEEENQHTSKTTEQSTLAVENIHLSEEKNSAVENDKSGYETNL